LRKFSIGLLLVAGLAAASFLYWRVHRRPTLVGLQKQILFAATDAEKRRIVEHLERYYRTMPISVAARASVDEELAKTLASEPRDSAHCQAANAAGHQVESQLKCVLKAAAIARARESNDPFQEHLKFATQLVPSLSFNEGPSYWSKFIETVSHFDQKQATNWLKAEAAEQLCRKRVDEPESWEQAEQYAALGLALAEESRDARLALDILQRLQFLLFEYYGLHDLSVALAESTRTQAEQSGYRLRATGISFYQACAFQKAGRFEAAQSLFNKVLDESRTLPEGDWYTRKSLSNLATVYRELGEYQKALETCDVLETFKLRSAEQVNLHITRGLANRSLGNYQQAEEDYTQGLRLARQANHLPNQENILVNLGHLYFLLTDYDRALDFFSQAQKLQKQALSKNAELEVSLLLEIAGVLTKKGDLSSAKRVLQTAGNLVQTGSLPWRRAELLNSLGVLHLELNENEVALSHFRKALAACEENGLLRVGLQARLNLIEALLRLSQLSEADRRCTENLELAATIDDRERVIDSLAMSARIAEKAGRLPAAAAASNRMVDQIERTLAQMNKGQLLLSFQQKIYDYLKQGVLYELGRQQTGPAFLKLDFAKNLWSKRRRDALLANDWSTPDLSQLPALQARLRDSQSLLVHYLVMPEHLYAFVADGKDLSVLQRPLGANQLKSKVTAFRHQIDATPALLDAYHREQLDRHFKSTTALGRELFDDLLGWPELQSRLKQARRLHVVPDESLHELPFGALVPETNLQPLFLAEHLCVSTLASGFTPPSESLTNDPRALKVLLSVDARFPKAKKLAAFVKTRFVQTEELAVENGTVNQRAVIDRLARPFQIYLLLGHGIANSVFPERSSIELSVRNSRRERTEITQLTLSDLEQANWSGARLVLLAGCETAGGKLYRGSGISSLQQSLTLLGAGSVVASLWKIDAAQAIPQIETFLETWLRVLDPGQALNEVQREAITFYRQNSYYRQPHPYLWASYFFSTSATHY